MPMLDAVLAPQRAVIIDYTNHRGDRRERKVFPYRIEFRETPDHKPAQWVMSVWDPEKRAQRTFALKNIHSWRIAPQENPE
jgi:predicted DNA-binding transcriptional regulator YafY